MLKQARATEACVFTQADATDYVDLGIGDVVTVLNVKGEQWRGRIGEMEGSFPAKSMELLPAPEGTHMKLQRLQDEYDTLKRMQTTMRSSNREKEHEAVRRKLHASEVRVAVLEDENARLLRESHELLPPHISKTLASHREEKFELETIRTRLETDLREANTEVKALQTEKKRLLCLQSTKIAQDKAEEFQELQKQFANVSRQLLEMTSAKEEQVVENRELMDLVAQRRIKVIISAGAKVLRCVRHSLRRCVILLLHTWYAKAATGLGRQRVDLLQRRLTSSTNAMHASTMMRFINIIAHVGRQSLARCLGEWRSHREACVAQSHDAQHQRMVSALQEEVGQSRSLSSSLSLKCEGLEARKAELTEQVRIQTKEALAQEERIRSLESKLHEAKANAEIDHLLSQGLREQGAASSKVVSEQESVIKAQQKRLDEMQARQAEELIVIRQEHQKALEQVRANHAGQAENISSMEETMQARMDESEAARARLKEEVDAEVSKKEEMEHRNHKLNNDIEDLVAKCEAANKRARVAATEQLDLEQQVEELTRELREQCDVVVALEDKVVKLEAAVNEASPAERLKSVFGMS